MNITECPTCQRMWNDTDNTGVCPNGHETRFITEDDDDDEVQEHLRKVTW